MFWSHKEKKCELLFLKGISLDHRFFFRPCAIVKKSEPEKRYLARVEIVRPTRIGQVEVLIGPHKASCGRPHNWKEIVTS